MDLNFYIVAGANGSGKSTFFHLLLQNRDITYINTDLILATSTEEDINIFKSGKLAIEMIYDCIARRVPFGYETTLSGKTLLNYISLAKEAGYETRLVYFFVDKTETLNTRINIRYLHGGHYVEPEVVNRRYNRSIANFWNTYRFAVDKWFLYNNSYENPTIVATGIRNHIMVLNEDLFNDFKTRNY